MKKYSVTIGIPAHNESRNIPLLLIALSGQKEQNIEVKSIVVISDGSDDTTVEAAGRVANPKIKIVVHRTRAGKAVRVNELLRGLRTDFLVVMDADSLPDDRWTIERLVMKLVRTPRAGLALGNGQPVAGWTFIEKAVNGYRHAQAWVKPWFDFGKTAYYTHGFIAYRREFAKHLVLPRSILNDDTFGLFACLMSGRTFTYADNAIIWYRSPQTIADHIHQSARHLRGGTQLTEYFPKKLVESYYHVPFYTLLLIALYQLTTNPLGYLVLKSLNIYCAYRRIGQIDIKWAVIRSSKVVG